VELSTQPVVLSSLVDEVVATASPLISKRDNRMLVNMPEDLGTLDLDALKVRQCLLNLLSNAAKFTTKGTILLSVLSRSHGDVERLVLEVTDDGIGIAPDALERIFQSFAQAENDTVSRFGGAGLGLALTKRFCQMMGGDIQVRSQRGTGSSFTIDLPLIRARAAANPDNQRAA
jgi:signal transduction histidine kinase